MYLFIVTKKKEKEIQKKRNIKSRKMLVSKVFYNTSLIIDKDNSYWT